MNINEMKNYQPGAYVVNGGIYHEDVGNLLSKGLDNKRIWYKHSGPCLITFINNESKSWKVGDNIILTSKQALVHEKQKLLDELAKEKQVRIFITKVALEVTPVVA